MSQLLVAQRALTVPGWAKDELWRKAQAIPSLDLRFADSKSLVDAVTGESLVTFARAFSGTYVGSDGVLRTAATNEPRFDHNPTTGESLGLLVEEARTNSIRNNTMVGAVAGTPGTNPTNWIIVASQQGLTKEIVDIGTENGISYIDVRIFGTATASDSYTAAFASGTEVVASNGQSWTASVYARIVSGSTTGISATTIRVRERTSVGAVLGSTTALLTNPANLKNGRVAVTRVLSNATAAFVSSDIAIAYTNGAAIDITLRIGLPQLEQGALATSVISTTTAAATRSADMASITGANFSSWYRQDEGTVFAECALAQPATGGNQFVFRANDNSSNNNTTLNIQSSGFASIATAAGGVSDGAANTALALSANTAAKFAGAYAANNLGVSLNGATAVTDTSATMPTALNRLDIGSDHAGLNHVMAGTIRRLTYWPQALPSRLQVLTQ